MESQSSSASIARNGHNYSDKVNLSRRSVDWRDSGIVIDEDYQFNSFDVICGDFPSSLSGKSCTQLETASPYERIVYEQDDDGDTILHLAVVGFALDKVKDLIKICDLDAVNNMIQTPVHVATMANRPEMVDLLIEAGSRYDIHDRRGNTPLHLACQKGHIEIVKILLDFVMLRFSQDQVKNYMEMTNFEGQTCLHLAATHKRQNVIELLVQKYNADVNCKDSRSGHTILHKAIISFNVDLVSFILKLGQHCVVPDFTGRTPSDTIRLLRESRLDSDQPERLSIIEMLVDERIKSCIEQNGCCFGRNSSNRLVNNEALDPSSSSSDYSDSDSDMS